ncbi:hypothetical protein DFH06DRAFT_1340417 [Mycena polygramma]|nr:hypothetical protein DFH06DRAFT_1340417 [Mycena polygramma]
MPKQATARRPKKCSQVQKAHIKSLASKNKENELPVQDAPKAASRCHKPKDYKLEYSKSCRKIDHMNRKEKKHAAQLADLNKVLQSHVMSRRTVGRAILEGGIAARMQLTHELSLNEGVTHRVPDDKKNPLYVDPTSTPRIRHAGVNSTLYHGSQRAVDGWIHHVESTAAVYNASPLAARLGKKYTGTANGLGKRKHEETVRELGEDALSEKSIAELVGYLQQWNAKKTNDAGGIAA